MKIISRNIGRIHAKDPENILIQDYKKRIDSLGKSAGITGFEILEYEVKKNLPAEALKHEEATLLLRDSTSQDMVIALDERGKNISSIDFANILNNAQSDNIKRCFFLIGGAHGLSPDVRKRANHIISFGKMTVPHKIARILLTEQIYRAMTIIKNHPYHKI